MVTLGCVGHVSVAHPVCDTLRQYLHDTCVELKAVFHENGKPLL